MDDTELLAIVQGCLGCHAQQGSRPTFCARHPYEAWTHEGCPVAVRAAFRLSSSYHGTAEDEKQLQDLIASLESDAPEA